MRYKSTDDIEVILLDKNGYEITREERESIKDAKDRAKYLISDAYAKSAETTHENLGTDKVEIRVNGECIYDWFYEKE